MFEDIAEDDFEAFRGGCSLESLGDFSSHTRIGLAGDDLLCLFENLGRQVSCSGTDFEDDLGKMC